MGLGELGEVSSRGSLTGQLSCQDLILGATGVRIRPRCGQICVQCWI